MALRVYDTQGRDKRPLETVEPGKVRMYVCGMTVQDKPHVGHLRSAVVHDVIRRYLEHLGYEVKFVYNFTDVDDKIIARGNEEGVPYQEVAQRNIDAYFRVANAMSVRRASVYPRATEHIPEIQALIQKLIDAGYAYAAGGDVYYDVRRKQDYGKLSGRDVDELRSGARIESGEEKRDPLDFALWKGAKPGEPAWDSPWGPGRPGWHIECSAMSMKHLGETLDLHGGGADLIFPHHENEIAQSEAATGKPFVRYWVHNGMVNIDREKMSKSEKRFILVEDLLAAVPAEVIRFHLLLTHYRSPIEFGDERLDEARTALDRLRQTIERHGGFDADAPATAEADPALEEARQGFHEAMQDDFNTARALGHLFDMARAVNRIGEAGDRAGAQGGARLMRELGNLLGLFLGGPRQEEEWTAEVLELVSQREEARSRKDWGQADALRSQLSDRGVLVEDSPGGPRLKRR